MIKVLLADDDYIVKDVLLSMIPWKELDMEVIGFVENGQQALDLCLLHKPELLEGSFVLAKELDHLSLSFGIGLPVDGIHSVSSSYYGALKALDYKFYMGSQSIIQIDDITAPGNFRSIMNEEAAAGFKLCKKSCFAG